MYKHIETNSLHKKDVIHKQHYYTRPERILLLYLMCCCSDKGFICSQCHCLKGITRPKNYLHDRQKLTKFIELLVYNQLFM